MPFATLCAVWIRPPRAQHQLTLQYETQPCLCGFVSPQREFQILVIPAATGKVNVASSMTRTHGPTKPVWMLWIVSTSLCLSGVVVQFEMWKSRCQENCVRATPSVPNYKSFQFFWKVKASLV